MSHEAFLDHWHQRHAPLVRRHAKAIGLVKYVQSHGLAHPLDALLRESRGAPPPYDGIAELYCESIAALERNLADPAAQAAALELLEDERQFIDLAQSPLFLCDERPIIENTGIA